MMTDTTISTALARIQPSQTNAMTDRAFELRAPGPTSSRCPWASPISPRRPM
jgi:aspartate aminotransferase